MAALAAAAAFVTIVLGAFSSRASTARRLFLALSEEDQDLVIELLEGFQRNARTPASSSHGLPSPDDRTLAQS